jgi:hypothetical protein
VPIFFPTSIAQFLIELPWTVTISSVQYSVIGCDFTRTAFRQYSGGGSYDMQAAEYQNVGPMATSGFNVGAAIVSNIHSFSGDGEIFHGRLLKQLFESWARYQATLLAIAEKPDPGIPDPSGIIWPMTESVVDYIDGGGSLIPKPQGSFAAFRLFPLAEYGTVSELVDYYRGSPP